MRTQRGFQARGLRMCLSVAGGLSSALLPSARPKPSGDPSWVWGFLLPSITSEAFICMTRGIKMLWCLIKDLSVKF